MNALTALGASDKLLSQNSITLHDGCVIVTEIIQVGKDGYMATNIMLDAAGVVVSKTGCGYCAGKSVGCITCTGDKNPTTDCGKKRMTCV